MEVILDVLPGGASPLYSCVDNKTQVLFYDGCEVMAATPNMIIGENFLCPIYDNSIVKDEEKIIGILKNCQCTMIYIVKDDVRLGTGYFGIRLR